MGKYFVQIIQTDNCGSHVTLRTAAYLYNVIFSGEDSRSFLLLDQEEQISVESVGSWCEKLGCDVTTNCKVVSILGNTGEGKSHTLNHTFFAGAPVFR